MENNSTAYWKATLGLLTKILIIWFLVSFGAGILFAPGAHCASGLPPSGPCMPASVCS